MEDCKVDKATEEKYLGDRISVDGKNVKNIEASRAIAQGIIKQLQTIWKKCALDNMCLRCLSSSETLSSLMVYLPTLKPVMVWERMLLKFLKNVMNNC